MLWSNGTASSEWRNELQLDRWLVIGIESSYASLKHHDNLYSNGYIRNLYEYSRIDSDGKP